MPINLLNGFYLYGFLFTVWKQTSDQERAAFSQLKILSEEKGGGETGAPVCGWEVNQRKHFPLDSVRHRVQPVLTTNAFLPPGRGKLGGSTECGLACSQG